MRSRLYPLFLLTFFASVPLLQPGCERSAPMPFTAEADDPDYRRGKDLLRSGRDQEALVEFLKVIDRRGGAAAESHLEAGILYHKSSKDFIAAIYHYQRYVDLRPNTEQARLVDQSIKACIREFARTLPARPLDNQVDRTDLMDAIDRLQRENLSLKEQLVAARAAVLDTTRQAASSAESIEGEFAVPLEPSQGGFAGGAAARAADLAVPVPVTPIAPLASAPALTPAVPPAASPASAPSARKHIVSKGDTLMSISLRHYGSRTRWREIYAVNRDVLPNEAALKIGMELRIP